MWLARKKNKFVDGKEIYGKTFNQSEISSVARFLNFRNDQILLETVKLVEFLVVNYWRFFHRRPPANVPRLGLSGLAPPIYLQPHFPPKKTKQEKCIILQKRKKSLLLLTPHFFIDFILV